MQQSRLDGVENVEIVEKEERPLPYVVWPRRMSSRLLGASGAKKSGIVRVVR